MTQEVLTTERDGGVAVVTMNRPHTKNALNRALLEALTKALGDAAADPEVRAIVLTGSGGSFCSGADLKAAMTEGGLENPGARVEEFHQVIRAVTRAPKIVLAAVDGPAVGFGCDLALACDLRIASPTAYFQEKFVKIGLMPDGGGTFWLPRLVGLQRAMEIMLFGEPVNATRSLELGLVGKIVPQDELLREAMTMAHTIAKGPPLAYAWIKKGVAAALGGTIDDALATEKEGQTKCLTSADCMEGVMSWMEKREPRFSGR